MPKRLNAAAFMDLILNPGADVSFLDEKTKESILLCDSYFTLARVCNTLASIPPPSLTGRTMRAIEAATDSKNFLLKAWIDGQLSKKSSALEEQLPAIIATDYQSREAANALFHLVRSETDPVYQKLQEMLTSYWFKESYDEFAVNLSAYPFKKE